MKNLNIFCFVLFFNSAFGAASQDKTFFVLNATNSSMSLSITDEVTKKVATVSLTPGNSFKHPQCIRGFLLKGSLESEKTGIDSFDSNLGIDEAIKGLILSSTKIESQMTYVGEKLNHSAPLYLIISVASCAEVLESLKLGTST